MRLMMVGQSLAAIPELQAALPKDGAPMEVAFNAAEAIELATLYEYDAIFTGMDLNTLRTIRNARVTAPVIMLTTGASPSGQAEAFRLGADDIVQFPIDAKLLWARIAAVVRRARGQSSAVLRLGELTLDVQAREVTANGVAVILTRKEFDILQIMMLRPGRVIRKEGFLSAIYGGLDEPEDKTIDVMICKLRKKLGKFGLREMVRTVWGQGYMVPEAA